MPLLDKSAFTDPTLPIPSWAGVKSAVRGLMGAVTPPDPYEEAGRMVQQARGGDYLGALETGFGAMPTTGAIKAYHGSPHSFDKFDLSKIGTGEGAQAYGHGLYFAEAEPTAQAYRDSLRKIMVGSKELGPQDVDLHFAGAARKAAPGITQADADYLSSNFTEAIREGLDLNALEKNFLGGYGPKDDMTKAIKAIAAQAREAKMAPGHMYEVNINAEPEHFLDWDKPLSEHPQAIQEKLSGKISLNEPVGSSLHRAYRNQMFGGDVIGQPSATADEVTAGLNKMGIPGIKYLDQGSRNPTQMLPQLEKHLSQTEATLANFDRSPVPPGMDRDAWRAELEGKVASLRDQIANTPPPSRNYVVFDDKLVDIARKYGLLPLGMGGFDFSQNEQK